MGWEYSLVGGGFAQRERNSGIDPSMCKLGGDTWEVEVSEIQGHCSYTEMLKLPCVCVCVFKESL